MMMNNKKYIALCFIAANCVACLDATAPRNDRNIGIEPVKTMDMMLSQDQDLNQEIDQEQEAPRITGVEADRLLAEQVAFIETTVMPTQTYYAVGDVLNLTIKAYNEYGELLPEVELVFTPRPDGAAEVDYSVPDPSVPLSERSPAESFASLTPSLEGQGAVRICARRNPDVCGRASYFVDNGPPIIELTSPMEDAVFIGEQAEPRLAVEGTVSGQVALYINEKEVDVEVDGSFSHELEMRFGYNTIEVAADDGFRRPLTRILRTVLYAPNILPVNQQRVEIPAPVTLRVPPAILDGEPPTEPLVGESPLFTDLAHSLAYALSLVDPSQLANTDLSDGQTVTLSVIEASLGQPEVDLIMQDNLIEVFIRLPNLSATTQGLFTLQDLNVGLNGIISTDVSSFVSLRPELVDDTLTLRAEASGVAIENIRGVMEDPVAQALIDTLTSALRLALSQWADQLVSELLQSEVPTILNTQLGGALDSISAISFDIIEEDYGIDIRGSIGFGIDEDNAINISARDGISLGLEVVIDGPGLPEDGPQQELPANITGVPSHNLGSIPWPAHDEIALAVPLSTFNAALYQVWAQGAFSLDLSEAVPAAFSVFVGGLSIEAMRPPLFVDTPIGDPAAMALSLESLLLTINAANQVDPPDPALQDIYRISLYFPLALVLEESIPSEPEATLDLSENPRLRVSLWKQGGDRPIIPPHLIETTISSQLVNQLEDILSGGLAVPLPNTVVNLDSLLGSMGQSQWRNLSLKPRLSELLRVENGWFIVSSGIGIRFQ